MIARIALLIAVLAAGSAACARVPEPMPRTTVAVDAWNSPAAAYNKTLDGGGLALDLGPASDLIVPDMPKTELPIDTAVADTARVPDFVVDTALPDAPEVVVDVPAPDAPQFPPGPLAVLSAFSPDGKSIKVRFNKPVDSATVAVASCELTENSQPIKDDAGKPLSPVFTGAALAADPSFVGFQLAAPVIAKIKPALTYEMLCKGLKSQDGEPLAGSPKNKAKVKRTVYLHLLWHQHQPTYLDPIADQLLSPWVRKHATKDYYDMAAVLKGHPGVHLTINLTPVLVNQLVPYYLERLGPFVDTKANTVDIKGFLAKWKGKTDPWIDLLLEPTPEPKTATEKQIGLLYADPWSCVSTAPVLMNRFPDYAALREKSPAELTRTDLAALKVWFEFAWLDPDFLHGKVTLATGDVVDLTDVIQASKPQNATFTLKGKPATSDAAAADWYDKLAVRLVAEELKIMKAVLPVHQQLAYDPDKHTGQIEISTTPFYHPILPLVHDTDLMGQGQPFDPKPTPKFSYPQDAAAQVSRAVAFMEAKLGQKPRGMWPGEGSVAEAVIEHFVNAGVLWVATDQAVMEKSGLFTGGAPVGPWKVDVDGSGGELAVFFRNTSMSNDIGFAYQGKTGQEAADDLIKNVAAQAPGFGAADRVVTLVLDGENAWETFSQEHDGKGFFTALYSKLETAQAAGEIITVSGSEYLLGNPQRNVPAHPTKNLPKLEPLFAGSWIGGNFAIWIGESEENTAWGYLLTARKDLDKSGLVAPPGSQLAPSDTNSLAYHVWAAFDEVYAAEGSDWFWWYGSDMTSPSNDDSPFDAAFRTHLAGMYAHMNEALKAMGKAVIAPPTFKPIIQANPQAPQGPLEPPPTLDGLFLPNESEWSTKGGFFFDSDTAGALANPDDWIATVYYGFGKNAGQDGLYLAAQHNFDLSTVADAGLAVYFSHKHIVDAKTGQVETQPASPTSRFGDSLNMKGKGAARELWVKLASGKATPEWRAWDGKGPWSTIAAGSWKGTVAGPVKGGKVLEMFVPYADLGIVAGDPLEITLIFAQGGKAKDLAPSLESKLLVEDPTTAMFVTFVCDARGEKAGNVKLDFWNPICTQPPPTGKGIVYIAGNDPKLGMKAKWVPNKVALRDDGKEGDEKAGDGLWSGVFTFPKGASLKYKYTIGLPANEGQWNCTEEFPLTERGLEVSKDPSKGKVKVSDVFADRPTQTGQQGPKSVITVSP
jgi:alpha-amylase/alpha-mannosidase (GH57 family)